MNGRIRIKLIKNMLENKYTIFMNFETDMHVYSMLNKVPYTWLRLLLYLLFRASFYCILYN